MNAVVFWIFILSTSAIFVYLDGRSIAVSSKSRALHVHMPNLFVVTVIVIMISALICLTFLNDDINSWGRVKAANREYENSHSLSSGAPKGAFGFHQH